MELASKLNLLVGVTTGLGLAAWVDRRASRGSRSNLDLDAIFAEVEALEKLGGAKVKKPKAKPKTRTRATPQQTSVTWQPSAALSQRIDAMQRQIDEGGAEKRAWQNEGSKRWLAQAQVLLDQARSEDYAKAMTGHRQRGEQLYEQDNARRRKSYEIGSLVMDEFFAAVERLPAKQRKIEWHALKWHDRRTPYNQEYNRLARLFEAHQDAPYIEEQGSRALDMDAIFAEVEALEKVGGVKAKKPKAKPKTRERQTPTGLDAHEFPSYRAFHQAFTGDLGWIMVSTSGKPGAPDRATYFNKLVGGEGQLFRGSDGTYSFLAKQSWLGKVLRKLEKQGRLGKLGSRGSRSNLDLEAIFAEVEALEKLGGVCAGTAQDLRATARPKPAALVFFAQSRGGKHQIKVMEDGRDLIGKHHKHGEMLYKIEWLTSEKHTGGGGGYDRKQVINRLRNELFSNPFSTFKYHIRLDEIGI